MQDHRGERTNGFFDCSFYQPIPTMRFADFKTLSLPEQAFLVYRQGVLLAEREADDCIIALYQLEAYYVEVYYRACDSEILKFLSFHSTLFLDPYLKSISLQGVLPVSSACY